MFRSPYSGPSVRTTAINSSRKSISARDSSAVFAMFFPGILRRNHHPAVPAVAREIINTNMRRHEPVNFTLATLCAFHSAHLHLRFGLQFRQQLLGDVGRLA